MLMKNDKRKMATIIVAKMNKNPEKMMEKSQHEGAEQETTDELDMIAEEVMNALQSKDVKAFKEAMKSMIEVCMNNSEDYEEESEVESED
jgi:hypothetical protein